MQASHMAATRPYSSWQRRSTGWHPDWPAPTCHIGRQPALQRMLADVVKHHWRAQLQVK